MKKWVCMFAILCLMLCGLSGCGSSKETIVIYTSMEDFRVEYLNARLSEEFPQYNIIVEYMTTGNHAARLLAEGVNTECQITHNLEYGYLQQLDRAGILADLSDYDTSVYVEEVLISDRFLPQERNGGCIIVNTELLAKLGLSEPASYEDLLKPEYKNLISMPNPKSSGTGYMFLKALVNEWGEDEALSYFDRLTDNILQYTSSGSGPLNAVLQGEAAIGLAMTGPSVMQLNEGRPIKILYFEEGSPYSMYGQSMIKGQENNPAVREVFDFLVHEFTYENCERYFPEKLFADRDYTVENYPNPIAYADMSGDTAEEKVRLLELWKY